MHKKRPTLGLLSFYYAIIGLVAKAWVVLCQSFWFLLPAPLAENYNFKACSQTKPLDANLFPMLEAPNPVNTVNN